MHMKSDKKYVVVLIVIIFLIMVLYARSLDFDGLDAAHNRNELIFDTLQEEIDRARD
ncbi:MAG: hypothetical protein ACQEQ4_06985 [Fibrobacterota bacterium]